MKKGIFIILILTIVFTVSCDQINNLIDTILHGNRPNLIRIGYTDYSFDQAIVMVLKCILDQQPNLEVEIYRLPDSTMFRALADDELDVAISAWLPYTHQTLMEQYPYQIERHSLLSDSLGMYLVVPNYAPLTTMEDFRHLGVMMGNSIIVPESENAIYHFAKDIIKDYDLRGFTLTEMAWDDIIYFMTDALAKTSGFSFVAMRPHWIFRKHDIKILADNRQTFGEHESAYMMINPLLNDRMPAIANFLSKVNFTLTDIETLLDMNQQVGTEPYENALRWIHQNTNKVNMWLVE